MLCPGAIRVPIPTGGVYGRMTNTGASDEDLLKFWERMRPMAPDQFAARVLRAVLRGGDRHSAVLVESAVIRGPFHTGYFDASRAPYAQPTEPNTVHANMIRRARRCRAQRIRG